MSDMKDKDDVPFLRMALKHWQELCQKRKNIDMLLANAHIAVSQLAMQEKDKEVREAVLREIEAARRKPAGLTEAISNSLRQMMHSSLSANEVRGWLVREGFDLSDYSQPLATISVTLGRLAKSGRVKATRKGRNVTYQWIGD
jgi:hypothetical protein